MGIDSADITFLVACVISYFYLQRQRAVSVSYGNSDINISCGVHYANTVG